MSALVRDAHPDDAASIASVHVRAWQDGYRGQVPDHYLDSLSIPARQESWQRALARPQSGNQLVAERDGVIVGIASIGPSRDRDADASTGELLMINVVSEAWGDGVGQALLDEAVARLRARGYATATLWVLGTNARARRFYERNGWTPDGADKDDAREGFVLHEVRYRIEL